MHHAREGIESVPFACRDLDAVFAREVAYAAAQIRRAPHNDSAWAYLRGLPALPGQAAQLAYEPGISAICLEVTSALNVTTLGAAASQIRHAYL